MKKPKRKVLMIEVETTLTNEELRSLLSVAFVDPRNPERALRVTRYDTVCVGEPSMRIVQVQVNDVGAAAPARKVRK